MEVLIKRAHSLGKSGANSPTIAHLANDYDIQQILKNAKKLQGTEYFTQRDFSRETRFALSKLFQIKKNNKRCDKRRRCYKWSKAG